MGGTPTPMENSMEIINIFFETFHLFIYKIHHGQALLYLFNALLHWMYILYIWNCAFYSILFHDNLRDWSVQPCLWGFFHTVCNVPPLRFFHVSILRDGWDFVLYYIFWALFAFVCLMISFDECVQIGLVLKVLSHSFHFSFILYFLVICSMMFCSSLCCLN